MKKGFSPALPFSMFLSLCILGVGEKYLCRPSSSTGTSSLGELWDRACSIKSSSPKVSSTLQPWRKALSFWAVASQTSCHLKKELGCDTPPVSSSHQIRSHHLAFRLGHVYEADTAVHKIHPWDFLLWSQKQVGALVERNLCSLTRPSWMEFSSKVIFPTPALPNPLPLFPVSLRHTGTADAGGTHLGEDLVKPLQGPIQV